MKFTDAEKKCVLIAMDQAAAEGEIIAAAGRFVTLLRKRYADGYALLQDLEKLPERLDGWGRRRAVFGKVQMTFGKYKGRHLDEIPATYLLWVLQNVMTLSPPLRESIEGFLDCENV